MAAHLPVALRFAAVGSFLVVAACGGSDEETAPTTASTSTGNSAGGGGAGGGGGGGAGGSECAGPCPASNIKYLVVIIQENHTFENHFGQYCKAAPGSNPTCNDGPSCCEAGPDTDPGTSAPPAVIDDTTLGEYDPIHLQACELEEMDGGLMDKYLSASCSDPRNFAYSDPTIIGPYWQLAKQYALADRYFQPIVGASSSNDMYIARAQYVFTDNTYEPQGAVGAKCIPVPKNQYTDTTIGDLLNQAGVPWAFFAEGYKAMADLNGSCPTTPPAGCPAGSTFYPCVFDPGDVPFEYYTALQDKPATMRDLTDFAKGLSDGTLPAVSFVKGIGYKSEHPGFLTTLSDGVTFTTSLIQKVLASPYAAETLILLTYDEGGGYFDHVAPPGNGAVDGKPYGTRVPTLAIGPFAKKNFVSHVTMEHGSIVQFIEWNWLNEKTGQLAGRDTAVSGIGSLLDPATTGAAVPE